MEENLKGLILLSLGCKPIPVGACLAGEVLAGSSPELSKSMCKALKGHWFRQFCSRTATCGVVVLRAPLRGWIMKEKLPAELWASTWV